MIDENYPDNVEAVFEEFNIPGCDRTPEVDKLATALWKLRKAHERYTKWVFDTDNGRRKVADYFRPYGTHEVSEEE